MLRLLGLTATTAAAMIGVLVGMTACHNLEEIANSDIHISANEYIDQIQSYDQTLMVIVKTREFRIYKVIDGNSIREWGVAPHSIDNAGHDYLTSFCTHGFIAFLKKKVIYLFRLSEDKKSIKYNVTFPAEYFKIESFSLLYSLSPWNNTMMMKTGDTSIHMFDFRILNKPSASLFVSGDRIKKLDSMRFIDHGEAVALMSGPNLEIIESRGNRKRKKIVEFEENILDTSFQHQERILVIVLNTQNKKIIKMTTNNLKTQVVNIDSFKNHDNTNMYRLSRTGTENIGILFKKEIRYFDESRMYISNCHNLPPEMKDRYDIVFAYRLSNIIQTRDLSPSNYSISFKFFRVSSNDKQLCHPSCSGACKVPFAPCSQKKWVLLAMAISLIFIVASIGIFAWILTRLQLNKIRRGKIRTTPDYLRLIRMAHFDVDEDSGIVKVSIDQEKLRQSLLRETFISKMPHLHQDSRNPTSGIGVDDSFSSYQESNRLTL